MKNKIQSTLAGIFYKVPQEYKNDFKLDCLEKNTRRFSILPFFNIATQIACIFIYLYVYPSVYPERKHIDVTVYLIYTSIYCLLNIAAIIVFMYFHGRNRYRTHVNAAHWAVYIYIMIYVVLESAQVAIEFEISGNIYRFLATFFIVCFFPIVDRLPRFIYMVTYIVISELEFYFLKASGVNTYSYAEINFIVFIVCLVAANVFYNGIVRNFELRKRLEFLSMNDELTGLANRRSLNHYITQCWNTAIRNNGTIGILMIDIDHFKRYNDTYGHQAGDNCLALVAKTIKDCFDRATDLSARYGGEEFVVVIAHSPQEGALLMAERVRAAVEALKIPHDGNPPFHVVTCSIGVTVEQPKIGQSPEILLNHADEAMYRVKSAGRNHILMYSQDS